MKPLPADVQVCPYCGYDENSVRDESCLKPGTILQGRYLTGKPLGAGGFGITYVGYDMRLDAVVAIKEYLPGDLATRVAGQTEVSVYTGDDSNQFGHGKDSFMEEAAKLAGFRNEKEIVHVLDYFEENNTAYIVMELLEGKTVKSRIREGVKRIPVEEATDIMKEVLRGLVKVHKAHMLHRDIAPDNIYLLNDGSVKIFDFGSARTVTTGRTRSLTVEIKAGYSPVEQYTRNGNQGPWTDVYAAAATFYRMITGRVPQGSMERKEKDRLLPPSKTGVKVPKGIENAIMNALCVRPEERTQSAEEFLEQLENADTKRKRIKNRKADIGSLPLAVKILVPLAVAALIGFGILLATGTISFETALSGKQQIAEGMVRIPNLVNSSVNDAMERAKEDGFEIQIVDKEYSDTIPISRILSQSVSAGSIADQGITVEVVLSAGIEGKYAPYVTGLSREEIESKLLEDGFKAEFREDPSPSYVRPGCAISQEPAAETAVNTGDTIVVTLSSGADGVRNATDADAQKVAGKSWEEALQIAEQEKFYLARKETVYSTEPEGNIINSQASSDAVITTVSAGRERTIVPEVAGGTLDAAKQLLDAAGLTYTTSEQTSTEVPEGTVMTQSVASGERIPEGTEIALTVSAGAPEPETEAPTAAPRVQQPAGGGNQNVQPAAPQYGEPPTIMDNNG